MRHVLDEEPLPPRAHDKNIPLALETIVLKAIAKAPGERYATAQQFADDLQRWLDDKPILARRPTLWERAARWQRRHQSFVRTSIGFLFLTLLGLLATTILIAREHGKTTRAYNREMLQRTAAEESFRQAREAVDTFSQLGEEEVANTPEILQLRREILQTALEYYNSFLDQRHDDPSAQAELSAASDRIARIVDELSVIEGFAPMMLLSHRLVQQELSMTSDQRQQIDRQLSQLQAQREQARPGERKSKLESRRQQLADLLRSRQEEIVRVLTREQLERLQQIAWQQRLPFAFKYPEIITALNLSPRQRQDISEIIEEERPGGPDHHGPRPGELHLVDDLRLDGPSTEGASPASTAADRHPAGEGEDSHDSDADFAPRPHRGPPDHRPGDHGPGDHGPGDHSPPSDGPFEHGPPDRAHPDHGPPHHGGPRDTIDRTVTRILQVLTPDQRAKWNDLVGAPFTHDLGWGPHDWLPR